jgi:hypothetical protein
MENIISNYVNFLIDSQWPKLSPYDRLLEVPKEMEHVSGIINRVRYFTEKDQYNKSVILENLLDYANQYQVDPLPVLKAVKHIFNWDA